MDAAYHVQRAELLIERQRYEAAQKELIEALKLEPENIIAKSKICWSLYQQGNYTEAESWAKKVVAATPDGYEGLYYMAICNGALDNIEAAQSFIDDAISKNPNWAGLYAYKASLLLKEDKWEEAEKIARKGLAIDADSVSCLHRLNSALAKQNAKGKLDENLKVVLEKSPDNAITHASVGWSLLETNRPKQARVHFETALALNPNDNRAREGLLETIKAQNPIYRVLLNMDFKVAAQTHDNRVAFMVWSFLGLAVIGYNLTVFLSPVWAILIIPVSIVTLLMWIVKWLATKILYFTHKKYRYLIQPTVITWADIVNTCIPIGFFIVIICVVTGSQKIIFNSFYFLGALLSMSIIWRAYYQNEVAKLNTAKALSIVLTAIAGLLFVGYCIYATFAWIVALIIFGIVSILLLNKLYKLNFFD